MLAEKAMNDPCKPGNPREVSKDDFITKIAYKYPLQSKKVIEDYKKFYSL